MYKGHNKELIRCKILRIKYHHTRAKVRPTSGNHISQTTSNQCIVTLILAKQLRHIYSRISNIEISVMVQRKAAQIAACSNVYRSVNKYLGNKAELRNICK